MKSVRFCMFQSNSNHKPKMENLLNRILNFFQGNPNLIPQTKNLWNQTQLKICSTVLDNLDPLDKVTAWKLDDKNSSVLTIEDEEIGEELGAV